MAHPETDLPTEELDPQPAPAGINLVSAAWRRKSLLVLGTVLGLVVGAVYYSQRPAVYQSSAQVMVIKKRSDPVQVPMQGFSGQMLYDDYASAHAALLRCPLIVDRAVKEHNLQELPSLAGKADPGGLIRGSLTAAVAQVGDTSPILNLSYRGAAPEDCTAVLTAVIDTYEKFLEEAYQNVNQETAGLIKKGIDLLETDLKNLKKKQQELRAQAPILIRNKEGGLTQQDRLADIETRRSALRISEAAIRSRIAKIQAAVDEKKDPTPWMDAPLDSAQALAARPEGPTDLASQILTLQMQEESLAETEGPDHPELRAVRKRLETLNGAQAHLLNGEETGPAAAHRKTPASPQAVQDFLATLHQHLESSDAEEKSLDALYQEELQDLKRLSTFADQEEELRKSISDTQQMLDSLMKPLQEIDLAKGYTGYNAQTIAPPGTGVKVEPNAFNVFPLAGFAGLAFGLGLVWLAEVSDKTFRNPEEIRRRLGQPILGHVPPIVVDGVRAPEAAELDPSLCTVHRFKSPEAEAYRGVRTALYFSTKGQRHKVIQVTSPDTGDGKTTLAANLAVSIAQSGKRVLLIDADCRRPRQHHLFNLVSKVGLASVITGEADPEDAIQSTAIPNLWVLPCGTRPHNPAELLTSLPFAELLALLRERYDFVIIDTPPLLAVSDPLVVAPRVDGVLLTLRVTRNGRPNAERANGMLSTIGATVLGVVVNTLHGDGQKGYGGGGYTYDYGYMSGYYQDSPGSAAEAAAEAAAANGVSHPEGQTTLDASAPAAAADGAAPLARRAARKRKRTRRRLLSRLLDRLLGS